MLSDVQQNATVKLCRKRNSLSGSKRQRCEQGPQVSGWGFPYFYACHHSPPTSHLYKTQGVCRPHLVLKTMMSCFIYSILCFNCHLPAYNNTEKVSRNNHSNSRSTTKLKIGLHRNSFAKYMWSWTCVLQLKALESSGVSDWNSTELSRPSPLRTGSVDWELKIKV